eukprot:scaffold324351_cov58-Tisochrysis_lutea.AAC.1
MEGTEVPAQHVASGYGNFMHIVEYQFHQRRVDSAGHCRGTRRLCSKWRLPSHFVHDGRKEGLGGQRSVRSRQENLLRQDST